MPQVIKTSYAVSVARGEKDTQDFSSFIEAVKFINTDPDCKKVLAEDGQVCGYKYTEYSDGTTDSSFGRFVKGRKRFRYVNDYSENNES